MPQLRFGSSSISFSWHLCYLSLLPALSWAAHTPWCWAQVPASPGGLSEDHVSPLNQNTSSAPSPVLPEGPAFALSISVGCLQQLYVDIVCIPSCTLTLLSKGVCSPLAWKNVTEKAVWNYHPSTSQNTASSPTVCTWLVNTQIGKIFLSSSIGF